MTFFSRPILEDVQFRQISGSTLTLSGITRIATPTGLQLTDGNGGYRSINATSGSTFDVLTLMQDGTIRLAESTASGVSGYYDGRTPSTIDLGGIDKGTTLTGRTLTDILEELLTPPQAVVITNPTQTFSLSVSGYYEVGIEVSFNRETIFNEGSVIPQYDENGDVVSTISKSFGVPKKYVYTGDIEPEEFSLTETEKITIIENYKIIHGNNISTSKVFYDVNEDFYNEEGNIVIEAGEAYDTGTKSSIIKGIFPYYYGKYDGGNVPIGDNRPTKDYIIDLIENGNTNKVVLPSENTIEITFNSNEQEYIWFAIPTDSDDRKWWYVNEFNQGSIGVNVDDLFPVKEIGIITSNIWDNVNESPKEYKIYISNYQTSIEEAMELRQ